MKPNETKSIIKEEEEEKEERRKKKRKREKEINGTENRSRKENNMKEKFWLTN